MKSLVISLIVSLMALTAFAKTLVEPTQVTVEVTEKGFVPNSIDVKAGANLILVVTRKTDTTCATDIQIPSKKIKKTDLPLGKPVTITLGIVEKGEIRFGCGMNMMDSGQIHVH